MCSSKNTTVQVHLRLVTDRKFKYVNQNFLLHSIWSDMGVNFTLCLLQTEHLTNDDQWKVTETYTFLTDLYVFSASCSWASETPTHAVKAKSLLLSNDQ